MLAKFLPQTLLDLLCRPSLSRLTREGTQPQPEPLLIGHPGSTALTMAHVLEKRFAKRQAVDSVASQIHNVVLKFLAAHERTLVALLRPPAGTVSFPSRNF